MISLKDLDELEERAAAAYTKWGSNVWFDTEDGGWAAVGLIWGGVRHWAWP